MRRRLNFLLTRPGRILLFASMVSRYGLLSLLKPFVKLEKLIAISVPKTSQHHAWSSKEVMVVLHWLNKLRSGRGDCLILTLVGYRFLYLSGERPVMIVGMKPPGTGHAWLENDGSLLLESLAQIAGFSPVLRLKDHHLEAVQK